MRKKMPSSIVISFHSKPSYKINQAAAPSSAAAFQALKTFKKERGKSPFLSNQFIIKIAAPYCAKSSHRLNAFCVRCKPVPYIMDFNLASSFL